MSDNWTCFVADINESPCAVAVNLGIAQSAPLADRPKRGRLLIQMRRPNSDGLFGADEYDALIALEDALIAALDPRLTTYVGRLATRGTLHLFAYAKNDESFLAPARRVMQSHAGYEFVVGVDDDPDWCFFSEMLCPSPEDQQRAANQRVCAALAQNGDTLRKRREINHYAYFESAAGRDAFAGLLPGLGYAIDGTSDDNDAPEAFGVAFSNVASPIEIDDETIVLSRLATDNGGDYDGWETQIQR